MEISKELLEARERLLEAEWAAPEWNPPFTKPREAKPLALPAPLPPPLPATMAVVDLDKEEAYVEKLRREWQTEKAAYDKVVAECASTKTTPPHNYWEKAYRAHGRYAMAKHALKALIA